MLALNSSSATYTGMIEARNHTHYLRIPVLKLVKTYKHIKVNACNWSLIFGGLGEGFGFVLFLAFDSQNQYLHLHNQ